MIKKFGGSICILLAILAVVLSTTRPEPCRQAASSDGTAFECLSAYQAASQSSTVFKISVDSISHSDYGLAYPITYKFVIPETLTAGRAFKSVDRGAGWVELTAKTAGDFFNSVEAARFDYANNRVYVSASFPSDTDYFYLKVTNQTGVDQEITYDSICAYYDERKCVVAQTIDTDGWPQTEIDQWIDLSQARNVWVTVGIVTSLPETSGWTDMQSQIDEGYVEAASHSRSHANAPSTEVSGSKQDIIDNLDLPAVYKKGSTEYVPCWIEPSGYSDSNVRSWLASSKYLCDRDTTKDDVLASWASDGLYDRIGATARCESGSGETLAQLQGYFDADYANGGIFHLWGHPYYDSSAHIDVTTLTAILDYVGNKTDVWYVGFGALYMYDYGRNKAVVEAQANHPPDQPSNVFPADAAAGVDLTTILQSSAFSDADVGDTHFASQWQVTATPGDYSSPVFDSNADTTHLLQITLSSGILSARKAYYWHVRYRDNREFWSSWSAETYFVTVDRAPDQPTNSSPSNGATGIALEPTLWTSPFSDPDAGDTHAASQWQVTTTPGNYSSHVFDSGADSSHLVQITLQSGILSNDETYYWHVRYQDGYGAWSTWSAETAFTTLPIPPSVTTDDVGSISTSSAHMNGTLDSLGTASSVTVSFVWGMSSGSYPNETAGEAMASTGAFFFDLQTLAPGTTYYYKAKAAGRGDVAYGDEKSFTTSHSPVLIRVEPSGGKRKHHVSVAITGAYFDGATSVSFGSGITVDSFTVNTSTEITAQVVIDGDAELGARDVTVATAWGTATKTDGFNVLGGGGGVCSVGETAVPGAPTEMTATLAALGLLLGALYVVVKAGVSRGGKSIQA